MQKFYYINKIKALVAVNSCEELVTRMREYEWKQRSTNSDYMHVYAYWKEKNSNLKIRFENENDFVADLLRLCEIEQVGKWRFLFLSLFNRQQPVRETIKKSSDFVKIHHRRKHKKAV